MITSGLDHIAAPTGCTAPSKPLSAVSQPPRSPSWTWEEPVVAILVIDKDIVKLHIWRPKLSVECPMRIRNNLPVCTYPSLWITLNASSIHLATYFSSSRLRAFLTEKFRRWSSRCFKMMIGGSAGSWISSISGLKWVVECWNRVKKSLSFATRGCPWTPLTTTVPAVTDQWDGCYDILGIHVLALIETLRPPDILCLRRWWMIRPSIGAESH